MVQVEHPPTAEQCAFAPAYKPITRYLDVYRNCASIATRLPICHCPRCRFLAQLVLTRLWFHNANALHIDDKRAVFRANVTCWVVPTSQPGVP